MKKYLSSVERDNLAVLIQMAGHSQSIIEAWGHNLTKDERKWLKMAVSLIKKASIAILSRVDQKDAILVKKHVFGTRVVLLKNYEYDKMVERFRESKGKDGAVVNLDALRDMASMSLETTCRGCSADHTTCKFKRAYQELEIPYYDDTADGCPYRMEA